MPKGLQRRYGQDHLHFITFSCYRRLPLLRSVRARNIFVEILQEVRDLYDFALVGYVVMPEHIHLLISEPSKGTPSTVLQVLKQRVSRRLRRKPRGGATAMQLSLRFDRVDPGLPQFWQPRFYDFTGAGSTWSPPEKRLESEEESRETAVHAHESLEARTGNSSQRVALEQFLVLCETRFRLGPHRSGSLKTRARRKAPAFKMPEKRVESKKEIGKTPLHAHESVEKKIGRSSPGLAPGAGSTFTLNAPILSGRGARRNTEPVFRFTQNSNTD